MAIEEQEYAQQNSQIDSANRIRELEGKYNLLRDRVLLINNNMIEEYKKIAKDLKTTEAESREIKTELYNLKEALKDIAREISNFAKKDDIKVLEKYINMWDPLKFITVEEVEEIINKKLQSRKKEGEQTGRKRNSSRRSRSRA